MSVKRRQSHGRTSISSMGSFNSPRNDRRETADLDELRKLLNDSDNSSPIIQNSWIKSTEKPAKSPSRKSSRGSVTIDHDKENMVQAKVSSARSSRNDLSDFEFNKSANNRRQTVNTSDLKLLMSPNSSTGGRSSVGSGNRRDTLDTQDLRRFQMELENSVSISPTSQAGSKIMAGAVNVNVNPVDISDISFASSAPALHHAAATNAPVATQAERRETIDADGMAALQKYLLDESNVSTSGINNDVSTLSSHNKSTTNESRSSLRSKASSKNGTTPPVSSRSIRSLRSNSSGVSGKNRTDNNRRTTIDSVDMNWLRDELDASSTIYTEPSNVAAEAEQDVSFMSKASSKTGAKSNKGRKNSKRATPSSSVADSPASSVATMNTMDVANAIHAMLDDDDLDGVEDEEDGAQDRSMSTMDMDRSPAAMTIGTLEANTSMGTVNTMELIGNVEEALEEAAAMHEDEDTSSLLGLQDLINRNRQSSPEEKQQQAKKRKSRSSPAAAGNQANSSDSPAPQRNRMFSPEPAVNKGSHAMTVSTPSFELRPDQINSVLNHSMAGESFVLKSCFSARKQRPPTGSAMKSHNKSVVFASPDVAEFNKLSPVGRFTPMDKSEAKKMFLMQVDETSEKSEDEVTAENSRVLEEWDRLSSAGSYDGSDEEIEDNDAMDVEVIQQPAPIDFEDKENAIPIMRRDNSRRRLSRLQPLLELAADEPSTAGGEESGYGHTVELPANLADLVQQNEQPSNLSAMSEYDATVEMEANLHDLMRAVGHSDSFTSVQDSRASSQGYNPLGMMVGQVSFISSNAETGSDTSDRLSLLEGRPSTTYPMLASTSDASLTPSVAAEAPLAPAPLAVGESIQEEAEEEGEEEEVEQEGVATMEDVQEVFEYAEDDMHELDQSASFAQSVLIAPDEDFSSNASTLPDENQANFAANELSFVETKRRIIFGNTIMSGKQAQTPVHSSQQSVDESNALLRRIQQLKEGSRVNSLAQSMTPAGPRRPSMGQQRLSMMQQANVTAGIATMPRSAARPITRSTVKAQQMDDSIMEQQEDNTHSSPAASQGDVSAVSIAEQLLLPERSMMMHEEDSMSFIPPIPSVQVDTRGNLHKFYDVTQAVRKVVMHMDTNLQQVAYSAMLETFASATKCLRLGFEGADVESMLKMAWEINDTARFVDSAYETVMSLKAARDMSYVLLLAETDGWEQVWMNLVTAAMIDLSEGMQEQARKVCCPFDDDESIFSGLDQSRFFEKVMNRSTISGASTTTTRSQSICLAVNEFLRQQVIEQTEALAAQAASKALIKENVEDDAALDAEMLVRIANRVSFFRVQVLQEECIELSINLTETSMVLLCFVLQENDQGRHDVQQTEIELLFHAPQVDLKEVGGDEDQRMIHAQENALIAAYFSNVIASEQGKAPLSRSVLDGIAVAAQIPGLLEQISCYVVGLRQLVLFLRKLSEVGGLFMVAQEGSSYQLHMDVVDLAEPVAINIKDAMTIVQMNFEQMSTQYKNEAEQRKVLLGMLQSMQKMMQSV